MIKFTWEPKGKSYPTWGDGKWGTVWNGESESKKEKQGIHSGPKAAKEMGDW